MFQAILEISYFEDPLPPTNVSNHQVPKDLGLRIIFANGTNFVTPSEVGQNFCQKSQVGHFGQFGQL